MYVKAVWSVYYSVVQRVVLMSHNKDTDTISLRHYTISLTPTGLTKGIKSLVTGKAKTPDLSKFASVADFVEKAGYASDSDAEDAAKVQVHHKSSSSQRSRVRLHEVCSPFSRAKYYRLSVPAISKGSSNLIQTSIAPTLPVRAQAGVVCVQGWL